MNVERGTEQVLERVGDARAVEAVDETFEALYRQRYRDVYRYTLLMLRRPEDAEDVTGEASHRAYVAWPSGHGPSGQSMPWLLLIARRLVIDKMRPLHRTRRPSGRPTSHPPAPRAEHSMGERH